MKTHPLLLHMTFDRIVFNFPHASLIWTDHDPIQIGLHQELVRGFMRNAREMLSVRGEVHVTHKTGHPFSKWEIKKLGQEVGLCSFIGEDTFYLWDYPGYQNKKGFGFFGDNSFPVGRSSTFKFGL